MKFADPRSEFACRKDGFFITKELFRDLYSNSLRRGEPGALAACATQLCA